MRVPFLGAFANLRRGLRLLRRIGSIRGDEDLDKVVGSAARESDELRSRIEDATFETKKGLAAFTKHIDASLKRNGKDLRAFEKGVARELRTLGKELHEQVDEELLKLAASQQAAVGQVKTTNDAIQSLNEQMAAVREYAATQQERVRRYEEGYQWVVLKDFGLRIIRCIDDIESILAKLDAADPGREHLEIVRDQLVFALDAEAIEQFTPEVGSSVREEQRLFVESSSDVVPTENKAEDGTIASVERSGYRLYIDDQTPPRIVRPARAKVFKLTDGGSKDE